MDGLTAAYFVAFVAGAGFGVLSFLLGSLGGHGDGSGHAADAAGHALPAPAAGHALTAGHGHDTGSIAAAHGGSMSDLVARTCGPLLNVSAIAATACVGGGVGFLARRMGAGAAVSLLAAVPSGLLSGYLVGCLTRTLRRSTHYLTAESLGGTLASVIAPVSDTRLGEVLYTREGARCSLPARGASDRLLAPGLEVVILDVTDGVARVAPAGELLGVEDAALQDGAPPREALGAKPPRQEEDQ
jgi:hypothetical protein